MPTEIEMSENATGSKPNAEGFINKVEVARRLNIKQRTVDNWMRRRIIPYYKMGHTVLFRWNEIENHIGKTCRVLADGHSACAQQAVPEPRVQNIKPLSATVAHRGVSTRPQFQNTTKEKTNDRK